MTLYLFGWINSPLVELGNARARTWQVISGLEKLSSAEGHKQCLRVRPAPASYAAILLLSGLAHGGECMMSGISPGATIQVPVFHT